MAKQERKKSSNSKRTGSSAATAVKERVVAKSGNEKNRNHASGQMAGSSASKSASSRKKARRGFFEIYKPGQGQNTRMGSAAGYGALVCWFAYFLYDKFSVIDAGQYTQVIQVGVALVTVIMFGLLGYWILALNKRVNDFLIATEGEMKKVNWTSRKEIIGSTKVVIFVLVALSILLFIVDVSFMTFFSYIGILKGASFIDAFKELL